MHQLGSSRRLASAVGLLMPPGADRTRRVIVAGLLVTTVLVTVQATTQAIDFSVFNLRIWALNSGKHYSLFGLVSLLAQTSVAAASMWRGRGEWRHRTGWFALGALVGVLVIVRGLTTFNAPRLALPLVCVFALLCWLTWRDPGAARGIVWGGLGLLAMSLLFHKVGLAADSSPASDYTWTFQIEAMVKHGAELAGWLLVATGIAGGMEVRRAPEATADRTVTPELESIAG